MESGRRTAIIGVLGIACLATAVMAESRKEYRFKVAPQANVTVDTQYGAISVKPGSANQVVVTAIRKADKAEVDNLQNGNRIAIGSRLLQGADAQSGRVDYEVIVPPDAIVRVRSSTGPLSAEGLRGDVTLEGSDAQVDVRNIRNGHLHVKTMRGPITLTDVHNAHVEVTSISGDVHLNSVTGQVVQINSNSGKIFYSGDFGLGGDYTFITHTGDIDAIVPSSASAEFSAHSIQGQVQNEFPLQPRQRSQSAIDAGRSFFGTVGKAASAVVMKSVSGRIRLKQR